MSTPLRNREFKCVNKIFILLFVILVVLTQTVFKVDYNKSYKIFVHENKISDKVDQNEEILRKENSFGIAKENIETLKNLEETVTVMNTYGDNINPEESDPVKETDVNIKNSEETVTVMNTDVNKINPEESDPVKETDVNKKNPEESGPVKETDVNKINPEESDPVKETDINKINPEESGPIKETDVKKKNPEESGPVKETGVNKINPEESGPVKETDVKKKNPEESGPVKETDMNNTNPKESGSVKKTDMNNTNQDDSGPVKKTDVNKINPEELGSVKKTDVNKKNYEESGTVKKTYMNNTNTKESGLFKKTDVNKKNPEEPGSVKKTDANKNNPEEPLSVKKTDVNKKTPEESGSVKVNNEDPKNSIKKGFVKITDEDIKNEMEFGPIKSTNKHLESSTVTEKIKKTNGNKENSTKFKPVYKIIKDNFIKCMNEIILFQPFVKNKLEDEDKEKDEKFVRRHPNLPSFIYMSKNLSNLIPSIYNIRWSGSLYQESWRDRPNCFLYSANFDARLSSGPIIRVLGLCEVKFQTIDFFCQIWYNETENPLVSPVYEAGFPGIHVGNNVERKATMMSCKVPSGSGSKAPIAVALVKTPCTTSTNILKIGGSFNQKKIKLNKMNEENFTIGLCSKAIFYYDNDFSIRLIEWVEILRLLGISKFFLYRTLSHKNVEKVFDYYEKEGIADVFNFKHPDPYIQEGPLMRTWIYPHISQFASDERMYYNDCILRNKDNYDFLAIFDYDEMPILKKHKNLSDFLRYMKNSVKGSDEAAAFKLKIRLIHRNLDPTGEAKNISENLYVLRHNQRNPRVGGNGKSIYDTNKVLYVACHSLINHKNEPPISIKTVNVDINLAYTGHYKCIPCLDNCTEGPFVEENRLLEYASEIDKRMKLIREKLKI